MPKPRKLHFPQTVIFVTSCVEVGIMLPCNPLIEALLWSALARAQELYPIKPIALIIEGTHLHLALLIENPDHVKDFMRHFKTESSHSINALLGRKQRTIWCDGYHSPPVLTSEAMFEKLIYLYTNPAKDNLEESIDEYPGISTWQMFCSGKSVRKCNRIRRPSVKALPSQELTLEELEELAGKLTKESRESGSFRIFPNAWFKAFGIYDNRRKRAFNKLLKEEIWRRERELSEERRRAGTSVIGKDRLRSQGIDPNYVSKRDGRRMWCICPDKQLRIEFLNKIKQLIADAFEVLQRWKVGDYSLLYPLGLYPPSLPKLAEPMPGYVTGI